MERLAEMSMLEGVFIMGELVIDLDAIHKTKRELTKRGIVW